MKRQDIEVGKDYLSTNGYPLYGRRVAVLAVANVPYGYRGEIRPGWRVRRVDDDREYDVASRSLDRLWTAEDDAKEARYAEREIRVKDIRKRLEPFHDDFRVGFDGRISTNTIEASERLLDILEAIR